MQGTCMAVIPPLAYYFWWPNATGMSHEIDITADGLTDWQ